jgi:septum formation protein
MHALERGFLDKPIILASSSPRRQELLRQIGIPFRTMPSDVDEGILAGESPEKYAVRVALDKASSVASQVKSGIVIGADTIVVLRDEVLGKPADARDAVRMLSMLSGKMHRVITGLAVVDVATETVKTASAVTRVWFHPLSHETIESYVATGEPLDKAGAYGIQERGAVFVERVDGCYFNVVGLPLSLLMGLLRDMDIAIF